MTPIFDHRPHGVKKLLAGVVSSILSHTSILRRQSVDFWDGGFFTRGFSAVGR